jgi:hypothetical protein
MASMAAHNNNTYTNNDDSHGQDARTTAPSSVISWHSEADTPIDLSCRPLPAECVGGVDTRKDGALSVWRLRLASDVLLKELIIDDEAEGSLGSISSSSALEQTH